MNMNLYDFLIVIGAVFTVISSIYAILRNFKTDMKEEFKIIDERFKKIDERFEKIENRMTRLENDMIEIKTILRCRFIFSFSPLIEFFLHFFKSWKNFFCFSFWKLF